MESSYILAVAYPSSLAAQEHPAADVVFAAALNNVWQELRIAPPINLQHLRDGRDLPTEAIVVARQTIGGAPAGDRAFVDKYFGSGIAEEVFQSKGLKGPAPLMIDQ